MKVEGRIQAGPKNITEFNGKKRLGFKLDNVWYNIYGDETKLKNLIPQLITNNVVSFEQTNDEVTSVIVVLEKIESQESNETSTPTNRNNLDIDKRFIVNIMGKDFITYNGLLAYAKTQQGGIYKKHILELKVSDNGDSASARVRITMGDGQEYEDVGTCTPLNSKGIKVYPEELAVTRGYARAIRTGLGVDYCSKEEL